MSIGQRFVNLVRSNLTSLLERTSGDGSVRIENLSDDELERELIRRKQRREAAERAATATEEQEAWAEAERAAEAGTGRFRTAGGGGRTYRSAYRGPGSTAGGRDPRMAKLYAQLECPYGADATTVRKHYRKMMRKYHPDMHSGDTSKERIATELSQRLTMAYNELKRALK